MAVVGSSLLSVLDRLAFGVLPETYKRSTGNISKQETIVFIDCQNIPKFHPHWGPLATHYLIVIKVVSNYWLHGTTPDLLLLHVTLITSHLINYPVPSCMVTQYMYYTLMLVHRSTIPVLHEVCELLSVYMPLYQD